MELKYEEKVAMRQLFILAQRWKLLLMITLRKDIISFRWKDMRMHSSSPCRTGV